LLKENHRKNLIDLRRREEDLENPLEIEIRGFSKIGSKIISRRPSRKNSRGHEEVKLDTKETVITKISGR